MFQRRYVTEEENFVRQFHFFPHLTSLSSIYGPHKVKGRDEGVVGWHYVVEIKNSIKDKCIAVQMILVWQSLSVLYPFVFVS